jgi:hypothetical protein
MRNHAKIYASTRLIKMLRTLIFRRRIQDHGGYFLVSLPPSIVGSLNSKEVEIIVENGAIKLNPVRENNKEVNYEKE